MVGGCCDETPQGRSEVAGGPAPDAFAFALLVIHTLAGAHVGASTSCGGNVLGGRMTCCSPSKTDEKASVQLAAMEVKLWSFGNVKSERASCNAAACWWRGGRHAICQTVENSAGQAIGVEWLASR